MADLLNKVSVTPLDRCDWKLKQSLPINLGKGLSVQNYSGRVPSVEFWEENLSKEDRKDLGRWSVCLEHTYLGPPHLDGEENKVSKQILVCAVACLRFLVPSFANGAHCLQIEERPKKELVAFNYERPLSRAGLEGVEILSPELDETRLYRYRVWIDWIEDFAQNAYRKYQPLWISLNFSEKSYFEFYKPLRHVLRVMALEALFSDVKVYSGEAMESRLLPMIDGADLYSPYRSDLQSLRPMIADKKLIKDVVVLRNDIAHGRGVPERWLKKPSQFLSSGNQSYLDDLTDAATALLRYVWLHILENRLQDVFSDKAKMAQYCASGVKIK